MKSLCTIILIGLLTSRADTFIPIFPNAATGNHLLPGLLAYWQFDELSGNAIDASGNGRTLTINGSVTAGTGVVNGDRVYANADNGSVLSDQYFSRASESAFAFTGAATITAWANMTTAAFAPNDMTIIAKGTGTSSGDLSWWLSFDHATPNDLFHFYWSGDGAFHIGQSVPFDLGGAVAANWYFLVVRWDGATLHLSCTALSELAVEPDATASFSGPFYSGTSPLSVGALPADSLNGMNGEIDETGIWSRYLSDCEIAKLFTAKAGSFSYPSFDSNTCAP